MSNNDLDLEVQSITLQLQQLRVEQERLKRKLSRVQHKINQWELESTKASNRGAAKAYQPDEVPSFTPIHSSEANARKRKSRASIQAICDGLRFGEHPYTQTNVPKKGDYVRILNPKREQCNVRIVINFCNDGKLKIITNENTFRTRLLKNVHYYA